jgi:hypothetical protein
LHRHLRPISSLQFQLAREEFACSLAGERANERSQGFIATIARRRSSRSASTSPIALLLRPDHNAWLP